MPALGLIGGAAQLGFGIYNLVQQNKAQKEEEAEVARMEAQSAQSADMAELASFKSSMGGTRMFANGGKVTNNVSFYPNESVLADGVKLINGNPHELGGVRRWEQTSSGLKPTNSNMEGGEVEITGADGAKVLSNRLSPADGTYNSFSEKVIPIALEKAKYDGKIDQFSRNATKRLNKGLTAIYNEQEEMKAGLGIGNSNSFAYGGGITGYPQDPQSLRNGTTFTMNNLGYNNQLSHSPLSYRNVRNIDYPYSDYQPYDKTQSIPYNVTTTIPSEAELNTYGAPGIHDSSALLPPSTEQFSKDGKFFTGQYDVYGEPEYRGLDKLTDDNVQGLYDYYSGMPASSQFTRQVVGYANKHFPNMKLGANSTASQQPNKVTTGKVTTNTLKSQPTDSIPATTESDTQVSSDEHAWKMRTLFGKNKSTGKLTEGQPAPDWVDGLGWQDYATVGLNTLAQGINAYAYSKNKPIRGPRAKAAIINPNVRYDAQRSALDRDYAKAMSDLANKGTDVNRMSSTLAALYANKNQAGAQLSEAEYNATLAAHRDNASRAQQVSMYNNQQDLAHLQATNAHRTQTLANYGKVAGDFLGNVAHLRSEQRAVDQFNAEINMQSQKSSIPEVRMAAAFKNHENMTLAEADQWIDNEPSYDDTAKKFHKMRVRQGAYGQFKPNK